MQDNLKNRLIEEALKMREKAYCPYSDYQVGAAILAKSNKIYSGCNIENASYPATICAERTAAVKAVSEGEKEFLAVAVAVSGKNMGYPCGICRQFLNEFAGRGMMVYLINKDHEIVEEKFDNLFPHGFNRKDMD